MLQAGKLDGALTGCTLARYGVVWLTILRPALRRVLVTKPTVAFAALAADGGESPTMKSIATRSGGALDRGGVCRGRT